ncbi:MAG: hypothetical protein ACOC22_00730 [bacterium]
MANDNNQNIDGANPSQSKQNSGAVRVDLSQTAEEIFNPQKALNAVQTYMTFNNVINKMIGIEARWFRAVPQERSKDVMINEYTLYNTDGQGACLKVVVPEGQFPESKYQYDLMGLEYDVPLNIQIDKKYWEEIYGYGTAPQKKDIVYLPMPNKLYQVESAYLERGFMEQETHWNINLIKYQQEASRHESDELRETIDYYTTGEEELFGEEQDDEKEKITNDKQFSQFSGTSIDKYRDINKDLKIVSSNLNIYGVLVSETFYDMTTSSDDVAVKYKMDDNITQDDNRSYLSWVSIRTNKNKEHNVSWIDKDTALPNNANYKIKIKSAETFKNGEILTLYASEALKFYAEIKDNTNANAGVYYCKIDEKVENYLNSIKNNWQSTKNIKAIKDSAINLLNGQNDANEGLDINILSNKFIKVNFADDEYVFILPSNLNFETWYGVVVNIGNTWNQCNMCVWEVGNEENKLKLRHSETLPLTPKNITIDNYQLDKSRSNIANIRLFSTLINEENQAKELLSYFTKNADYGILLDNNDQLFTAPYISQQK